MTFTPVDPTKAEVRVTQDGGELDFDFYIPRGSKGEPGGWVAAVNLGPTANLDDIKVPGLYRQDNSASATAVLNYPIITTGSLEVLQGAGGSDLIQRYTAHGGGPSSGGRTMFQRRLLGTVWSVWVAYASQRIDQTAGRAIYQWDHLNNRDQFVYGDTGLRDIMVSHGNGTFGALQVRRVGAMVHLWCTGWTVPAGGGSPFATLLNGTGFRNPNSLSTAAVVNGTTFLPLTIGANFSSITVGGAVAGQSINFTITYNCIDPWPTTLPGNAYGTIPNL